MHNTLSYAKERKPPGTFLSQTLNSASTCTSIMLFAIGKRLPGQAAPVPLGTDVGPRSEDDVQPLLSRLLNERPVDY